MTVLPDRLVRLLRANGSASTSSDEAEELLSSDGFRRATAQLASQLGRAVADVQVEAAVYVREMAATHLPSVVRAW
jgi:glycerol-3-phosphate O-acyltransferase